MLCQRTTWRNILGSLLVLVCTKGATCKSEALTTTRAFLPRSLSGGSHPPLPVTAASYHSTSSQGEWDTAINEIHANRDQLIDAEFVAETNLPTDLGHFRLRAYRVARTANEFMGTEPTVIYCTDKPPFGKGGKLAENVPVRVHDQCLTSEVFRSQRYVFL
jgi:GTP cyclohydrolase II